jgi:o-succinylbenzoate synthase
LTKKEDSLVKITGVKTHILTTHLVDDSFVTKYGKEPETRNHVIVQIDTTEDHFGLGEAAPLTDLTGETPEGIAKVILSSLAEIVIGADMDEWEWAHEEILSRIPGNPSAKAAVDIALYDLRGKVLGMPVFSLLGGPVRECVRTGAAFGIGKPEEIASRARYHVENGAKAIKVKVGLDPFQDIETVRLVREAIGEDVDIRVDANGAYSFGTAVEVLGALKEFNIEYAEQPLPTENLEEMAELREVTRTPIMVDESLFTEEDAMRIAEMKAADFFGLKFIKHGGIHEANKIARIGEAHGIECVVISPWETQIGNAAGVHLALAGMNFNHAHDMGTRELIDDPVKGLEEKNGIILKPLEPGLGVSYHF